ncbi:60 kDa SS-A/Ro ribonucleoprotein [Ooceraea biroi]|uniref:60 kDa SS-A/Ro ribonucleoprotein n=1 Tax=Ooceraea biroi TaxID=2015173 RepID=A0A026WDP8_OOCBI|nr:60 kDa SS-A/Ro ribonucleoprotein [Ooceraea biroi]XP_026825742.1 60 kDa SS-A/Ro ribonucleoprotein [Ooceraea biroi]EZA53139.1 60 kDa SS-A/Ro ribonucleoprotein [Ooceraea biroi]
MAQPITGHVPEPTMNMNRPNNNGHDSYEMTDAELAGIEPTINDGPEARLSRFLYVGKEYPDYQPGYWFVHNYFIVKNVPSIEELAATPGKELVPILLITKAFESNLVPHPETLVFALAVCGRQTISEKLRHEAFASVQKICTTTEQFILFVRFTSKLKRENELCYLTFGWGNGMKKAVNNWYLSKEPLALAKCVTKYRSRYGWKHKDIIKLCHTVGDTPEKAVILRYIVKGLSEAKQFASELAENTTVEIVMKYIENIELFKHCEEETSAAALLQELGLSLEHVPGHLLKCKKIWIELISMMDMVMLLNNLQRINNLRLLKPNVAAEKVIELLRNEELIARDKVHPVEILIALINYQNCGKPLSFEKRRIREAAKKPHQLPFEPNQDVISALNTAFYASFSHLQRTDLRYLVTISSNKKTVEGRAWQCGNMRGVEVGCFIAMTLVRQESDVTVATFKDNEIHVVDVGNEETYEQVVRKLREISTANIKLSKPLLWAMKMKKEYDVFINIVDQVYEKHDRSQESLSLYRNMMQLPDAKLINCAVCSSATYRKTQYDKNVLIINGFDATVPKLIQAFVQSLF